jgi:hypothetical protein
MKATMPDRKSTMTRLLTMLNQWICVSVISRYVSDGWPSGCRWRGTPVAGGEMLLLPAATGWWCCVCRQRLLAALASQVRSALVRRVERVEPAEARLWRTLYGSTSKPTTRASATSASSCNSTGKRRWSSTGYRNPSPSPSRCTLKPTAGSRARRLHRALRLLAHANLRHRQLVQDPAAGK